MVAAAVTQWQGQQLIQSTLVSAAVAEPHHSNPMLQEAPSRGATVTNESDDKPEDTTITKKVVVIAMVVEA